MALRNRKQRQGFTLIELLVVVAVVAILASIGIPGLLSTRKAANEGTAIPTLKSMVSAEETYKTRNQGGNHSYGSLADLVAANHLNFPQDNGDGSYTASGYRFSTVDHSDSAYAIKAEPMNLVAGNRSFAVTVDGYVREKAATVLTESSVDALQALSIVSR